MRVDLSLYGTCAKSADLSVVDGVITEFRLNGGCQGWSRAFAKIAVGMTVEELRHRLGDELCCGGHLSCAAACLQELDRMQQ